LNAALQGGGIVTFGVDGTIVLTNPIALTTNVILDGTNHSITLSGGNAVQIFTVPATVTFTLRHCTLANGVSNGFATVFFEYPISGSGAGGAIYSKGNLSISGCTFSNNIVSNAELDQTFHYIPDAFGGAIYSSGTLSVFDSIFITNTALGGGTYVDSHPGSTGGSGYGGAIYNGGGTLVLSNVSFIRNQVVGGLASGSDTGNADGNGFGGAVNTSGSTLIANSVFSSNICIGGSSAGGSLSQEPYIGGSAAGGAIYSAGGSLTVSNATFLANSISSGGGNDGGDGVSKGGAIYNAGSALLTGNLFSLNIAGGAGGGDTANGGDAQGGAVYNAGSMLVQGGSMSNNSALGGSTSFNRGVAGGGFGGGVFNTGQLQITASVLNGNSADGSGVSIFEFPGTASAGFGGGLYNTGSTIFSNALLCANNAGGGLAYSFNVPDVYGNAWGGAVANIGYVQFLSTTLSNNTLDSIGPNFNTNSTFGSSNGFGIYNAGVMTSDTKSFLIGASPGAFFTYQWALNSNNIPGATNAVFNLGNVQFPLTATYSLYVSNSTSLVSNLNEIFNTPSTPMGISGLVPNAGSPAGGTTVTISGSNFVYGSSVYFGANPSPSVTLVNNTHLSVITPASAVYGPVDVTVTNGGDYQPAVVPGGFTYYAPPQNFSIAAVNGPGALLSCTGTPNTPYILFATTNLAPPTQWIALGTNNSDTNGAWSFIDTNVASVTPQFYRAAVP
jgi:hypothetical protein